MATAWASCVAIVPANPSLKSRFCDASAPLSCSLPDPDHQVALPLRLIGTRRQLVGHLLLSLLAVPALPALSADESPESIGEYNQYAADDDKYSLLIPAMTCLYFRCDFNLYGASDWIQGTGKTTGERTVTAFFPADDSSVNVNVLITSVGADYTSMGSFGTVDAFAETLVNGMDRSWKKPPGQAARLVNSKSSNGMYYVEYTVQKSGEKKRHLLAVIGMRFNGWYNRLYTVTGEYWEDDKTKYGPLLEKVVESFKFA